MADQKLAPIMHHIEDPIHDARVTGWQAQQGGLIWARIHLANVQEGDLLTTRFGRYRITAMSYLSHSSGNLFSALLELVS